MSSTRQPISVVIPVYNGIALLKKNLPLVVAQLHPMDEVVLIDDASTQNTQEWFASAMKELRQTKIEAPVSDRVSSERSITTLLGKMGFISCTLLLLSKNVRFARAVNTAVSVTKQDCILLINTDVSLRNGVIDELCHELSAGKHRFAVGCLEHEGDGVVGGKNCLWFERGLFQHSRAKEFTTGETAWVSGGSGLFDKRKWQQLGGFDPRFYPAYWEDVDLSLRAKKQGWQIWFSAQAQVDHAHESTNSTVFSERENHRTSFKHQQLFTRIHATMWQRLQYYLWLPYWWYLMKKYEHASS